MTLTTRRRKPRRIKYLEDAAFAVRLAMCVLRASYMLVAELNGALMQSLNRSATIVGTDYDTGFAC
jgi:hypothetical protein